MRKKHLKIAIALFVITGIVFGLYATGFFNNPIFPPLPGAVYSGEIRFTANALHQQWDTTDTDGAGVFEIWTKSGDGWVMSESLTMGTDTESSSIYSSGDDLYIVIQSTTTNNLDDMSYHVILPHGIHGEGPKCQGVSLWTADFNLADGLWVMNFKSAQEATPTMLGLMNNGTAWAAAGTNTFTFSSSIEYYTGTIVIDLATDDDALTCYYDPDEGEWDKLWLEADLNCTLANQGLYIVGGGWIQQTDVGSPDYFLDLTPYLDNGMLVRCSEEGHLARIEIPITFYSPSGDLDTSGTGDVIGTFTLKECSSLEDALKDSWDSDTLTNFAATPGTEVIEFTDG